MAFAAPHLYNGEYHGYLPDFLVGMCRTAEEVGTLILETKGHDPLEEVKNGAALRWVAAVNRDAQYGRWAYRVVHGPAEVPEAVRVAAAELVGSWTGAEE